MTQILRTPLTQKLVPDVAVPVLPPGRAGAHPCSVEQFRSSLTSRRQDL